MVFINERFIKINQCPPALIEYFLFNQVCSAGFDDIIGKYLSGVRKLDHVIAPKEGLEAQLGASSLPITFGMRALGMTRQIRDSILQRSIESGDIPALQGPDNVA